MTSSDALVGFVLARIDDRERHAKLAASVDSSVWAALDARNLPDLDVPVGWLEHLRDNSPARVLAKCEADRRIVGRCKMILDSWEAVVETVPPDPARAPYPDVGRRERSFAGSTLRDLAALDADHPDCQPEWST
jgi:hypothetical protein